MNRIMLAAVLVAVVGAAGFLGLTSPLAWRIFHASRDVADAAAPDLANGKMLFIAGDCAICHATPGSGDATRLGGGQALKTGFGTFYMPNISSDPIDGLGRWTVPQFVTAMREGVSPQGRNEYPAFPYTSYQRVRANDLRDLFGYIQSLPGVSGKVRDHDLEFPFNLRRGVGLWRLAFLDGLSSEHGPSRGVVRDRGRYLVEGPAHCAECHSPRNIAGAIVVDKRFAGGSDQSGNGYTPNITPDETGIGYWSENEIVDYLKQGTSPINIHASGDMAGIVANTTQLPDADLHAMAAYLKGLPGVDAPAPGMPEPNRTAEIRLLPVKNVAAARSRLSVLGSSPEGQAAQANVEYVVTTKSLYIDATSAAAKGVAVGKVLASTRLDVLGRSAGLIHVRIDGWQQDGSDRALYALRGQRIVEAVLTPAAIARVARTRSVRDPLSNLDWHRASLTAWVDAEGLNGGLQALWAYGSGLYGETCAACHALPAPGGYLANQWVGVLGGMKRYAALDDDPYRLLLAYLQYHSKDVGGATVAVAR
jgi:mono/diheme cytochrome c family protein